MPNVIRIGEYRVNWYELLLPLIFLLGWRKGGLRLTIVLLGLAAATALAVVYGSALFGVEPSAKSFALGRYLISYIAAVQIGLRLSFRDLDRPNPVALVAMLALFAIVLASAVSPNIRTTVAGIYGFEEHAHTRFQLIDPNPLVLSSVSIIVYFFASRGRAFGIRLMLVVPTVVTIVLAQQRTSLVLLLLLLFLSEYVLQRRSLIIPMMTSLLLSILLVAAIVVFGSEDPAQGDRFSSFSFERQSRGAIARVLRYQFQFAQIVQFPVLGVGRFPAEVGFPLAAGYPAPRVEPHSQYVGIVYEVGVLGALVFGLLMVQVFRAGKSLFKQRRQSQVAQSVLAVGVVYLVAMVVWETLYLPHWSVFFFLLFGAALANERVLRRRNVGESQRPVVMFHA